MMMRFGEDVDACQFQRRKQLFLLSLLAVVVVSFEDYVNDNSPNGMELEHQRGTRQWGKGRGQKRMDKKRGRTMDTSFVVSAAFCAPVVTESQNDMAVFVAIAVWTEMVAFLVVSKTREQGHARCFLTTRRAYLSTRPFFALEKKKRNVPLKGMNTKIRVGVDEGGVKYTLRVRLDEE